MYPLESTENFPYLGRTVAFDNRDWTEMYENLRKAQKRWVVVAKVLTKTGATVRAQEIIYKVVLQTVLLYESDSWVVTEAMLKVLEGFHHRVDRSIAEIPGWRVREEGWK